MEIISVCLNLFHLELTTDIEGTNVTPLPVVHSARKQTMPSTCNAILCRKRPCVAAVRLARRRVEGERDSKLLMCGGVKHPQTLFGAIFETNTVRTRTTLSKGWGEGERYARHRAYRVTLSHECGILHFEGSKNGIQFNAKSEKLARTHAVSYSRT